jgi:hypothetical protein
MMGITEDRHPVTSVMPIHHLDRKPISLFAWQQLRLARKHKDEIRAAWQDHFGRRGQ